MDGPGSALIGVGAIGVGTLLLYGAYKNIPVFGASGLFNQAVTTGKIVAVAPGSSATGKSGGTGSTGSQQAAGFTSGLVNNIVPGGPAAVTSGLGTVFYNAAKYARELLFPTYGKKP